MKHLPLGLLVVGLLSAPVFLSSQVVAGAIAESSTPGYRAEAIELKRDGSGAVTLTLRIYNDGDKKGDFSCELRADSGETCKQITGVYLIDGVNRKRYLVIRDSDRKCICTDTLDIIAPKSSVTVWAKFPEPPKEIDKMTVVVPLFLPLEGVPVTGP
jgi:hypothetical protein